MYPSQFPFSQFADHIVKKLIEAVQNPRYAFEEFAARPKPPADSAPSNAAPAAVSAPKKPDAVKESTGADGGTTKAEESGEKASATK